MITDAIINRIRQNRATERRLGRLWIRNIMRNCLRCDTARSFADLSTDLPIILIGAGLSLEPHIAHIKHLTDTYYIVAVDTALPILNRHDIVPDMIVVMESQVYNMRDFLAGISPHTTVAIDITSHPSLLRWIARQSAAAAPLVALFSSQFADIALLQTLSRGGLRPLEIPALGSVGVAALYLALILTQRAVYIVGLDFSYRIGKTHCRGAPFISAMTNAAHRLNPDPLYSFCMARHATKARGLQGDSRQTEPPLVHANELLAQLCSQHQRVYDCGREGLPFGAPPAELATLPCTRSKRHPRTKTIIQPRAHRAPTREQARRLVVHLHGQLQRLLAMSTAQYAVLFAGSGRENEPPALAKLDFLALDRDRLPVAQHYRYSALDYHRRFTHYLQAGL